MKKITRLKCVVSIVVITLAVTGFNAVRTAYAVAPVTDGAALFTAKCAKCHGANGQGLPKYLKKGQKDFTDKKWQKSKSNAQLTTAINNGKGEAMPAWKTKLTVEEIQVLVAYVRTLGK